MNGFAMLFALALLTCFGAATVGGVFFAFSTFVMRALTELPASQGVAAVQRINVVVLNPAFLGVFIGSPLLSWGATHAPWMLAPLEAASAEAQAYWPAYVREWTRWNHVRTAASLASAACAAVALVVATP